MNFHDLLVVNGVKERELREALAKSRDATRWIRSASGFLVEVLTHARGRARPGGKPARFLEVGQRVAVEIHRGTTDMLERRQR